MRALVLGGTLFVGPHLVRELAGQGHEVTVFHRGQHEPLLPEQVRHVHGDLASFDRFLPALRAWRPEVVIDMWALRAEHAERVLGFAGVAERAVVLSSSDVYRAFGRLNRTEPGPPEPVPLDEDAQLRERLTAQGLDYDKTGVERRLRGQVELPFTVLRLPAVHGPGDYLHRLYPIVKRMDDHRPAILLDDKIGGWRWTRGYVENVAHAVAMAVTDPRASGRTYNVADEPPLRERDWVTRVAQVHGWTGEIVEAAGDFLPDYLRCDFDSGQDIVLNTSRIRSEIGYAEVVSLDEGIERTIHWQKANPPGELRAWTDRFDYPAEDVALSDIRHGGMRVRHEQLPSDGARH